MLLAAGRLLPVPRGIVPTWSEFPRQQTAGILACDFVTVETVWLRTLYVFFFIELGTRRIHLGGVTPTPRPALGHPSGRESSPPTCRLEVDEWRQNEPRTASRTTLG
jgi:hypothetical protein